MLQHSVCYFCARLPTLPGHLCWWIITHYISGFSTVSKLSVLCLPTQSAGTVFTVLGRGSTVCHGSESCLCRADEGSSAVAASRVEGISWISPRASVISFPVSLLFPSFSNTLVLMYI